MLLYIFIAILAILVIKLFFDVMTLSQEVKDLQKIAAQLASKLKNRY